MSVLALLDEDDDSGFELLATAEKPKPKFDVSSALSGATAGALGLADAVAGFGRDLVDIDAKGPDRFRRRLYEQRAQSPDPEVAQEAQAYLQRAEEYVAEIKEGRLQRALERERIYAPEPGNVLNDVLFGVGKFLPAIGATAVNPAVGAGVLAGTAEAEGRLTEAQLRESGVNADAAAQAGTVTRVSTFAGGLLPGALPVVSGARLAVGLNGITARSLGTRMALRASTGGAINAGAGIGERLATSAILEHAGFAEQAKAYRWNDAMSLSVDAILGAAFGSIDSPASDPGITERALRDADYLHATKTTAPGIVASQRGAADHDAALRLAAETLDETGRVDVSSVYSDDDLFSPVVLQADDAADIDASDRVAEPEPRFLTRDQQMEGSIDALVSEITGLENDFIAEQKKLGLSLASFVVKKRGIRDDGGDVRSFMGEARTRPGLINSKGTPIDIMARAAQEAGWFTGVSREDLVQRFMEALEADVRGEKQYSDLDRAVTANVIELKQAIHFWNSKGVDTTAQGEELRQQVRDFLRAEQAQEQAQLDEAVQMPGFVDDVELAEYERLRAEANAADERDAANVIAEYILSDFVPSKEWEDWSQKQTDLYGSRARVAGLAGLLGPRRYKGLLAAVDKMVPAEKRSSPEFAKLGNLIRVYGRESDEVEQFRRREFPMQDRNALLSLAEAEEMATPERRMEEAVALIAANASPSSGSAALFRLFGRGLNDAGIAALSDSALRRDARLQLDEAKAQGYEGGVAREAAEWRQAAAKGLDMSQEARMNRAEAMGFNTAEVLYHGTPSSEPIAAFRVPETGKTAGIGVFLSASARHADSYADTFNGGGVMYPVHIRAARVLEVDAKNANWRRIPDPDGDGFVTTDGIAKKAKADGYDAVRIRNVLDTGADWSEEEYIAAALQRQGVELRRDVEGRWIFTGIDPDALLRARAEASIVDKPQETIVVFDPANIRSIHAAFDPSFSDSPSLLASGARSAGIAGSVDALRSSASRAFGVRPSVIDRLMQSGRVTVVADDAEARARLGATNEELPDGQGGVYRASTGEVVIVAANVEPETAHRVLLHEVGVHAGMRGLLGEKRFVELLSSVQAMLPEAVRTGKEFASLVDLVRAFGRDREALRPVLDQIGGVNEDVLLSFAEAEAFALQPEHRAEEALAYLVENAPDLPLVQRLLASIRQWLWRAFGSEFGPSLNVSDLQMMAVAALRRESRLSGPAPRALDADFFSFGRLRSVENQDEIVSQQVVLESDDGSERFYGWRTGQNNFVLSLTHAKDGSATAEFFPLGRSNLFGRINGERGEATRTIENAVAALYYDARTNRLPSYYFSGFDETLEAVYAAIIRRIGPPDGYSITRSDDGSFIFARSDRNVGPRATDGKKPRKVTGGLEILEAALQTAFDPQSGNSPGLLASFARVRTPEGRAELLRDITVAQGDDGSSAYGWRVGETAIAMVVRPKGVDGRFSVNFGALRQGGLSFARVGASSLEQTERILENVLAALRYDMQTQQRPRYEFFGADPQLAALYERILKRFGAPEGYAIEPDKTGVIRFVRTGEVVGAPDAEPVKISGGLRVLEALEAKIAPDAQPLSAQDAPRIRRIERVRGAAYDDLRSAFSGDVNPVVRAAADIVRSDPELRLETESGAINASDLVDAVSAQHRAAQEVAPVFGEAAQCAIANGGFEAAATTAAQPGASLLGAQALRIASIAGLSAGAVQLLQMDEAA